MKKISIVFFSFLLVGLLIFSGSLNSASISVVAEENSEIKSRSYILMEKESGRILKSNNEHEKNEVASMVKLMTTDIVFEKINSGELSLSDSIITPSEYACSMEGSEAFLNAGEEYKLYDILKSVIMSSANDSAVALAEHIAGSEEEFVNMMNAKAAEYGMSDTLYSNSTGLTNGKKQYSTAYDTAILLKKTTDNENYYEFSNIWLDKLMHENGRETELVNTNRLVKQYPACDIGKTGFTDEAGYCLSSSAKKNDMRLIAVVMGTSKSADRFEISKSLFNYGFTNYKMKEIISENDLTSLESLNLSRADKESIAAKYSTPISYCVKNGESGDIKIVNKFHDISLPLKAGDSIGTSYLTIDGVVVMETEILSNESASKLNYKHSLNRIFRNWFL